MSPKPGYHHKKLRGITMADCWDARAAYEAGESCAAIGTRLGLSHTTVRNRVRLAGGTFRNHSQAGTAWTQRTGYKGPQIPQKELWNWKGGRIRKGGYILVLAKDHPRANDNGYMAEHVLVAEKTIGRLLLPGEVAHHKNENKSDNRPENIQVMTRAEHARHHHTGVRRKSA